MNQHGKNNHIQSRPCPRCSVVQRTQVRCTTEYAAEQQDPGPSNVSIALSLPCHMSLMMTSLFKNANTLYLNQNQNFNSRGETETATSVLNDTPGRAPQVAVSANIFSHILITKVLKWPWHRGPQTTLAIHLSEREQILQMWGLSTL